MITPEDIENKEFTKSVRGYSSEEVDEFLDDITLELKALFDDNASLREENKALSEKCDSTHREYQNILNEYDSLRNQYVDLESNLYNTLEAAKGLMSDISASSEKKAELIVQNARIEAENIISNAKSNVESYQQLEKQLKIRIDALRSRFKFQLESELKSIDSLDINIMGERIADDFEEMMGSLEQEQ